MQVARTSLLGEAPIRKKIGGQTEKPDCPPKSILNPFFAKGIAKAIFGYPVPKNKIRIDNHWFGCVGNNTMQDILTLYENAVLTAFGFFWKAGWAFVLGYLISAIIQTFIPRKKLVDKLGEVTPGSLALSTTFGAISSSCSFAALATARALVMKGAHFILAIAFMFASTNLVIELGVLIWIFLGWEFLVAEIIGGLCLIVISSLIIKTFYPVNMFEAARKKVESDEHHDEDDFDWKKRLFSFHGWQMVGHKFVMDWQMVWKEILIGFTVAGFMATLVPKEWWATIFLVDLQGSLPDWLIALQNAAVAPFVAASTFIGSMGNIPLATVLNANGVMFAGIMGFIYSDLMVAGFSRQVQHLMFSMNASAGVL